MWGVVPSDRHDWAKLREDIQKCVLRNYIQGSCILTDVFFLFENRLWCIIFVAVLSFFFLFH